MQGPSAHIDFETRSATDLVKSGVYRYAEDPTTWPWGFCYRIGNEGPWYEWRPGWPDPIVLLDHIRHGGTVGCHNAAFERTIWNWVVVARLNPHWPLMTIQQQDCTMSRAAAIAHPQALGKLGTALGTSLDKDMEVNRLMMKMAKPRRFNEDGTITWWDDPADIDRNMLYCGRDVEVETQADEMLPPLTERERRVWEFDQLINERGVPIDEGFVERAAQLVEFSKKQNDRVMREITDRVRRQSVPSNQAAASGVEDKHCEVSFETEVRIKRRSYPWTCQLSRCVNWTLGRTPDPAAELSAKRSGAERKL